MEEGVKAKKGYSIWSLLVIMTLLGVWLAVPRLIVLSPVQDNASDIFFVAHQLCIWCSCGVLVWLATGKRRIVGFLSASIVCVCWLPAILILSEMLIRGNRTDYSDWLLQKSALYETFHSFYGLIRNTCGPYEQ